MSTPTYQKRRCPGARRPPIPFPIQRTQIRYHCPVCDREAETTASLDSEARLRRIRSELGLRVEVLNVVAICDLCADAMARAGRG